MNSNRNLSDPAATASGEGMGNFGGYGGLNFTSNPPIQLTYSNQPNTYAPQTYTPFQNYSNYLQPVPPPVPPVPEWTENRYSSAAVNWSMQKDYVDRFDAIMQQYTHVQDA